VTTPPAPDATAPPARWHGADYARSAAHHRAADDWFLRRHAPREHDVVVDLGCGSGEFTARLAALSPRGTVTGIDPDESMLEAARRHRAPNLRFVHGHAQDVDQLVQSESVDAVLSRAMLHWLPPEQHPRLYAAVFDVLRPGGIFHLEAGAPGNIAAVTALLEELAERHRVPPPPPFPDPGRAFDLLEAAGFELTGDSVRTVAARRGFTRDQLVGLCSQAVLVLSRHVDPSSARAIAEEAVAGVDRLRRHDGSWDQTFVRLELLVRRPG
jgi:SAM-dependent methyltransferase